MNLDGNQLDWLTDHLGHLTKVHKEHYRQMSGFIERVHITKMMLIQDQGLIGEYAGKRLADIDLTGNFYFDNVLHQSVFQYNKYHASHLFPVCIFTNKYYFVIFANSNVEILCRVYTFGINVFRY